MTWSTMLDRITFHRVDFILSAKHTKYVKVKIFTASTAEDNWQRMCPHLDNIRVFLATLTMHSMSSSALPYVVFFFVCIFVPSCSCAWFRAFGCSFCVCPCDVDPFFVCEAHASHPLVWPPQVIYRHDDCVQRVKLPRLIFRRAMQRTVSSCTVVKIMHMTNSVSS